MKELNLNQSKGVSGGFWGVALAIAAGLLANGIQHRIDRDKARREGMDPSRKDSTGL